MGVTLRMGAGRGRRVGRDDLWGPLQPQISISLRHLAKGGSVWKGRAEQRRVDQGMGERGIRCVGLSESWFISGVREESCLCWITGVWSAIQLKPVQSPLPAYIPGIWEQRERKGGIWKENFCLPHSRTPTFTLTHFRWSTDTTLNTILGESVKQPKITFVPFPAQKHYPIKRDPLRLALIW